ncbi:unnamed protein product [Adineta ricciae]|uniref:Uncharacterized protein n=1 Tax=Adineta ricciae TaxID=249248 RepID=A0A814W5X5_ADIRI|nr:unnamed protein product [Adineta ricciae]CAF1197700.1 unnamed protein product [Adineta ricciae]
MNNTCVILVLFFALVSCILSSYLDIPPPPERPIRFKTKEQIENYLKAVKDYYDAFKVKLVRRDDSTSDVHNDWNKFINTVDHSEDYGTDDSHDEMRLLKKLYNNYKQKHPSRMMIRPAEQNRVT